MNNNSRFNVIELANYVINEANTSDLTITQLQLQKVIYYIQGNFMSKLGYKAFDESIRCWTHGPVVREVWDEFSIYGRSGIRDRNSNITMSEPEQQIISNIISEKLTMNVWKMVDQTHNEIPWRNAVSKKTSTLSDDDMLRQFGS